MTDYTDTAATTTAAVVDRLRQAKEINLAAIGVFESLTSVLVPLSVSMLPNAEQLVPNIDTVVHRSFDTFAKAVESQYELGFAALDQLGSAAASS